MHRWVQEEKEETTTTTATTPTTTPKAKGGEVTESLAPGSEKGINLNLSKERRENLKSSMNKAIDVQRDGVFLKLPTATNNTILNRRKVTLDFELEF